MQIFETLLLSPDLFTVELEHNEDHTTAAGCPSDSIADIDTTAVNEASEAHVGNERKRKRRVWNPFSVSVAWDDVSMFVADQSKRNDGINLVGENTVIHSLLLYFHFYF
jgi:hypothetical protein